MKKKILSLIVVFSILIFQTPLVFCAEWQVFNTIKPGYYPQSQKAVTIQPQNTDKEGLFDILSTITKYMVTPLVFFGDLLTMPLPASIKETSWVNKIWGSESAFNTTINKLIALPFAPIDILSAYPGVWIFSNYKGTNIMGTIFGQSDRSEYPEIGEFISERTKSIVKKTSKLGMLMVSLPIEPFVQLANAFDWNGLKAIFYPSGKSWLRSFVLENGEKLPKIVETDESITNNANNETKETPKGPLEAKKQPAQEPAKDKQEEAKKQPVPEPAKDKQQEYQGPPKDTRSVEVRKKETVIKSIGLYVLEDLEQIGMDAIADLIEAYNKLSSPEVQAKNKNNPDELIIQYTKLWDASAYENQQDVWTKVASTVQVQADTAVEIEKEKQAQKQSREALLKKTSFKNDFIRLEANNKEKNLRTEYFIRQTAIEKAKENPIFRKQLIFNLAQMLKKNEMTFEAIGGKMHFSDKIGRFIAEITFKQIIDTMKYKEPDIKQGEEPSDEQNAAVEKFAKQKEFITAWIINKDRTKNLPEKAKFHLLNLCLGPLSSYYNPQDPDSLKEMKSYREYSSEIFISIGSLAKLKTQEKELLLTNIAKALYNPWQDHDIRKKVLTDLYMQTQQLIGPENNAKLLKKCFSDELTDEQQAKVKTSLIPDIKELYTTDPSILEYQRVNLALLWAVVSPEDGKKELQKLLANPSYKKRFGKYLQAGIDHI